MGQFFDDDEMSGQPRASKVKAARVAYITERIGLTPDESTKLWPLYNQYGNGSAQYPFEIPGTKTNAEHV